MTVNFVTGNFENIMFSFFKTEQSKFGKRIVDFSNHLEKSRENPFTTPLKEIELSKKKVKKDIEWWFENREYFSKKEWMKDMGEDYFKKIDDFFSEIKKFM